MNALDLYKTRKIGFFALGGAISALFYTLMEGMIVNGASNITDCIFTNIFIGVAINIVFGAFIGIGIGIFEVFIFNKSMRSRNVGQVLWIKAVIYLLLFAAFAIMISVTHAVNDLRLPIHHPDVITEASGTLKSVYFPLFLFYVTISTTGMIFLHQVNEKLGNGMFWQFMFGKYHRPKQEQRAFMFLDMKSSTSIAERLGSQLFYQLLNDFFADMTDTILKYQGEIYQYVGDEIIITWNVDRQRNFSKIVNCFFEIEKAIQQNAKSYIQKYGFIPEFKAAIHTGQVTAGEVGTIKREIVFSGDVLNTTARIQSLCNQYGAKLLVSDEFHALLAKMDNQIVVESLGKVMLKGKAEKVGIVKLEERLAPVFQPNWTVPLPQLFSAAKN